MSDDAKTREIVTADRRGTDGQPMPGAEMEHDTDDRGGKFSCFVSTRHNKKAIAEKLAAGWRLVETAPVEAPLAAPHAEAAEKFGDAAAAAAETYDIQISTDTEVSNG